jgi:hypothetical protein
MSMSERVKVQALLDEKNIMRISALIADKEMEVPPMDICCVVDISGSMGHSAAC